MMEAYARALVEERLRPRQHAELAAYVRQEYGPGVGPEFLFAAAANGAVRKPRKARTTSRMGLFHTLATAMKGLVSGNGSGSKAKVPDAVE